MARKAGKAAQAKRRGGWLIVVIFIRPGPVPQNGLMPGRMPESVVTTSKNRSCGASGCCRSP